MGAVHVVEADSGAAAGAAVFEAVAAVYPPAAAVAEAAEFLDVDVDQLAGALAFVAAHGLAGGSSSQTRRCRPWRVSTACTVEAGTPTSGTRRRGLSLRSWRSWRITASTAGGVLPGRVVGGTRAVAQARVSLGPPPGQPLVAGRS